MSTFKIWLLHGNKTVFVWTVEAKDRAEALNLFVQFCYDSEITYLFKEAEVLRIYQVDKGLCRV